MAEQQKRPRPSLAGPWGISGGCLDEAPTVTARPAIGGRGGGVGEVQLNKVHAPIMLGRARGCQRACPICFPQSIGLCPYSVPGLALFERSA